MKNLLTYLDSNNDGRFRVPLSKKDRVIVWIFYSLLKKFPFRNNLYIEAEETSQFYWDVLIAYIKKYYVGTVQRGKYVTPNANQVWFAEVSSRISDTNTYLYGHGTSSSSPIEAISKGIGEFLERKATFRPSKEDKKLYRSVASHEVFDSPLSSDFHFYSEEQKANNPFLSNISDTIEVLPVENLITRSTAFVPVGDVFWAAEKRKEGLPFTQSSTTSGCAGGFTLGDASLGALLELIERDSFCVHWLSGTSMTEIVVQEGFDSLFDAHLRFFQNTNIALTLFESTTDIGIPSVVACAVSKKTPQQSWVTASADLNLLSAIRKATAEMIALITSLPTLGKEFPPLPAGYIPFVTQGIGRKQRLELWKRHEYASTLRSTLHSGKSKSITHHASTMEPESSVEKFEHIVKKLAEKGAGYETVYRYKCRDYRLKNLGYVVVRIIVPKLYPLYLHEHLAHTKSKRIDDFVFWKTGQKTWKLNTIPHPFP